MGYREDVTVKRPNHKDSGTPEQTSGPSDQFGDARRGASPAAADPRVQRSRAAIVNAARELLVDSGAAAVTVEAVLQKSGVARATLYRHFPSGHDVLRAAVVAITPARPGAVIETGDDAVSEAPTSDAQDALDERGAMESVEESIEDPAAVRAELLDYLLGLAERLRTSDWARVLPGLLELVARTPSLEEHRRDLIDAHRLPLLLLLIRARKCELLPIDRDLEEVVAALIGPLFYRRLVTGQPLTASLCQDVLDGVLSGAISPIHASGHASGA